MLFVCILTLYIQENLDCLGSLIPLQVRAFLLELVGTIAANATTYTVTNATVGVENTLYSSEWGTFARLDKHTRKWKLIHN